MKLKDMYGLQVVYGLGGSGYRPTRSWHVIPCAIFGRWVVHMMPTRRGSRDGRECNIRLKVISLFL